MMATPTKQYKKSVDEFAKAMLDQLIANQEKGHWSDCSWDFLIDQLNRNLNELVAAVELTHDEATILRRAANVANFSMMIAENARSVSES